MALRQAQEAAARQAERERNLFALTVGAVTPLPVKNIYQNKSKNIPPEPLQLHIDEQNVLREAMSDEFDISTLLEVDADLSYRSPGIGPDVLRKLRSGQWSIQRQLDLHGLRTDEAREALVNPPPGPPHWAALRAHHPRQGPGARRARCPCSRARCYAGWCKSAKCKPLSRP